WYDGFIFGNQKEIYNPWSIINFLSTKILDTYWADSSSNSLVSDLLAHSDINVKEETEDLLSGKSLVTYLDEQIDFSRIYTDKGAIWSLLMSAGYVKPLEVNRLAKKYKLEITNYEAKFIIEKKIFNWFKELRISERNNFIQALLEDEIGVMNELMSEIAESTFSFFDTKISQKKGRREAENFYHGFVLGLIINLKERYSIISNRESGFGRYDICMYPKNLSDHGIVIEFKSIKLSEEENLEATCASALKQIKEKDYIKDLLVHNVAKSNIYVYGFAFQGKKVLILGGAYDSIDWDSIMKLNDGQS
ncbi:MAG: PD-(D/E)XK nuclease domain-containing protein, partial [Desulfovibrionaceae bacterium]|nr:PD-(D/E)XK nuclease domain-containing protein [Desulfovibrionaceae bacterium]